MVPADTNPVSLKARIGHLTVAFALGLFRCTHVQAADLDLVRFADAKQAQIREFALGITNPVPAAVGRLFDAVRVDDWATATNLAARIKNASGRYSNSVPDDAMSPALHTLIWPAISEIIGTYEQFHDWDRKWLHRFGRDIIDSLPRGSVYFGGTDPGRFVITALSEAHAEGKPFFTLTQNQLVDPAYLDYLRRIYGKALYIPTTTNDLQNAFSEYLTNAQHRLQRGELKPGEDVRLVGGRIQVSGQIAVMEINGLLVKVILAKNPGRDFYLEESFALEWMYPQLTPHGLIFQLHPVPLSVLPEATVRKHEAYWKQLVAELVGGWLTSRTSVKEVCDFADSVFLNKNLDDFKGDRAFIKNSEATKTYSKLRSSIAGLYVWRMQHARDADERTRMQEAADLALRQAYALCPTSPEAVFRFANFLTDLRRPGDAFLIGKTSFRLSPEDAALRDLVRTLRQAE